jgi:hypothetical protein
VLECALLIYNEGKIKLMKNTDKYPALSLLLLKFLLAKILNKIHRSLYSTKRVRYGTKKQKNTKGNNR